MVYAVAAIHTLTSSLLSSYERNGENVHSSSVKKLGQKFFSGARPRDRMCEKVCDDVHHGSPSYLKTVWLVPRAGRATTTMDQRNNSKATNQGQEA